MRLGNICIGFGGANTLHQTHRTRQSDFVDEKVSPTIVEPKKTRIPFFDFHYSCIGRREETRGEGGELGNIVVQPINTKRVHSYHTDRDQLILKRDQYNKIMISFVKAFSIHQQIGNSACPHMPGCLNVCVRNK